MRRSPGDEPPQPPPVSDAVEPGPRDDGPGLAHSGCDLRAALRAEGEADHLPVHARRPVAARPAGPQARPEETARPGAAALGSRGPAPHRDDERAEVAASDG